MRPFGLKLWKGLPENAAGLPQAAGQPRAASRFQVARNLPQGKTPEPKLGRVYSHQTVQPKNILENSNPKTRLKPMLNKPGSIKLWLKINLPIFVVPVLSKSMAAIIGP